jgi:hypothetical protein
MHLLSVFEFTPCYFIWVRASLSSIGFTPPTSSIWVYLPSICCLGLSPVAYLGLSPAIIWVYTPGIFMHPFSIIWIYVPLFYFQCMHPLSFYLGLHVCHSVLCFTHLTFRFGFLCTFNSLFGSRIITHHLFRFTHRLSLVGFTHPLPSIWIYAPTIIILFGYPLPLFGLTHPLFFHLGSYTHYLLFRFLWTLLSFVLGFAPHIFHLGLCSPNLPLLLHTSVLFLFCLPPPIYLGLPLIFYSVTHPLSLLGLTHPQLLNLCAIILVRFTHFCVLIWIYVPSFRFGFAHPLLLSSLAHPLPLTHFHPSMTHRNYVPAATLIRFTHLCGCNMVYVPPFFPQFD